MDEEVSNPQQTRLIYVRARSTEYGLEYAEKRDSLARFRRGLSWRPYLNISPLVFARIARPRRLSNTQQTLRQ